MPARSVRNACLLYLLLAFAPALAGEEQLGWVERRASDDLFVLRTSNIPVVFEAATGLLVEGDADDIAWLTERGYAHTVLDRMPSAHDYWIVGVRPDSDLDSVRGLGPVLLERENWLLIAVGRDTEVNALHTARVFVTRVPHEPLVVRAPVVNSHGKSSRGTDGSPADPLVQKIVDSVSDADIQQFWMELTDNPPTGTRYTTSQGCQDAADYCYDTYVNLGLVAEYQSYSANDAPNVIGTLEGALYPDRVYIGVAHLDDLPSSGSAPGADDNASGSVFVLESANALACWSFKSTVKFLNVTGEETGLDGSDAYAADAQARGEDIRGVVNMDMPGWEGDGIPAVENLDVSYNATSQWLGELFAECASKYSTGLSVDAFSCPSLTASDHYSFWQRGWSAIIGITDNEGYCGHGGNYPDYHTSNDTIANCGDPAFFYSAVRTGVATLAEMAEPFKVTFAQDFFACNAGSLEVIVGDGDLDTDPGTRQTVAVTVWSDTETTPETLTLTERDLSDRIFSGAIPTTQAAPVAGDGVLSVSPDDTVHADYTDALDCDGATGVGYTATALIDCTRPIISSVAESGLTDVSATITWLTDEDATSLIRWGESVPPGNPESSAGMTTDHAVGLSGLQACTVYFYEVESGDVAGNVSVDDSGGRYYRFETLGDFGSGLQPCHAGQVSVADPVYACGSTIAFEVVDLDLNADSATVEAVVLEVSSSSETEPETVTATETGPNTSVFAGSIASAGGAPAPDGVLQVAGGDVITVTYLDRDDGTGDPAVSFDTATADCSGPAISNLRVESLTDSRATIRWDTDEPADTRVEWGATTALGSVVTSATATTAHAVTITELDTCATFYFSVAGTDALGSSTVVGGAGQPLAFHSWQIPGLYALEDFEGDTSGWTLDGEWEAGPAEGRGGSSGNSDPTVAYNDQNLLGHDLSGQGFYGGDYEPGTSENASSPEWDASSWTDTELILYRRLNAGIGDAASLYLFTGGVGRPLFNTAGALHTESSFQKIELPVAQFVDGAKKVHLEFRQAANSSGQYSGWNVDDVIFKDSTLPDYDACMDCGEPPEFAGAVSATDNDACGAGGVTVSWDTPAAWGSGRPGTFAVYRDTVPGFTPSGANLVAAGLGGTSFNDVGAPTDQFLHYLVLAESDETCGGGPNNGGLLDDNRVYATVEETTSAAVPQEVAALRVDMVNHAHARLEWGGATGATTHRVYRAQSPDVPTFTLLEETPALVWEDLDQGGNANSYYYLVTGVNACGVEGP